MNIFQAIKTRRSVRQYQPKPVPEDKLRKVLEAARLAPSAHNAQDWKFVVVKDKEKREVLAQAAG
ncbi:nitroreductase, partial [Candidatus Wolfebacteria bacterium CG03_land_8_20_14_0_80_40_12]